MAEGLRGLLRKYPIVGLTGKEGAPAGPNGPAPACKLEISDVAADVTLSASHPSGSDWVALGMFRIKLADLKTKADSSGAATSALSTETKSARLGDAVAAGMVGRLVRVNLSRGPKVKGKDTYKIKIVNSSPMVLNGLALGGAEARDDAAPSVVAGMSLPPLKSLTVPASAEMVGRLHLKDGVRVFAADLSGL